jgi:dTDP-4-dehydrorhamnose reductase
LADNRFTGIIHVSGQDRLSRYALGQAIADRLGYPRSLVGPDVTPNLEGRAERPRDVSLDNHRARQVLHTPLCGVAEGLELVLSASKEWSR